jgi:KDO2-lipid IV(A) lauroyltransferase
MPVEKTRTTSIILFCFQCVPLPIRKLFFKFLLILFYHASAKHRLIALHNLHCAFPEKDMGELIRIAKGVYRNLAITAAEFFSMPSITRENLHEWVEMEGQEHFEAGIAQGKGLLTIIAHFGNWELMPVTIPLFLRFPKPSYIVYRPLDSPILDNMIEHVRTINGNEMIAKGGSGRSIIRPERGSLSTSLAARHVQVWDLLSLPSGPERRSFPCLWCGRNLESTSSS